MMGLVVVETQVAVGSSLGLRRGYVQGLSKVVAKRAIEREHGGRS